jgi:adenine-specific DNA methylase
MAVVCIRPGTHGKRFLEADKLSEDVSETAISGHIEKICASSGLSVPSEPISHVRPSPNARGLSAVTRHGFKTFGQLFTRRQLLYMLTNVAAIREADRKMAELGYGEERKARL